MSENWIHEATPGHEGRLIGLVQSELVHDRFGDEYRELRDVDVRYAGFYPYVVQVGCTCGWRSPRLEAPIDLLWQPTGWTLSSWYADVCYRIWIAHAKATTFGDQERERMIRITEPGG